MVIFKSIVKTLKYSCFIMVIYTMICNPYFIQNTLYITIEYIPWLTESVFYYANTIKEGESGSSLSLHTIEATKDAKMTASGKFWKESDGSSEPLISWQEAIAVSRILCAAWYIVRTLFGL